MPAGTYAFHAVVSLSDGTSATSATANITVAAAPAPSPAPSMPSPWTNQDVGATGVAGSTSYASGVFTVKGAGTIWDTTDSFQFVDQAFNGDVTVVARLTGIENTNTVAKPGIMIRESSAAGAAHVILGVRLTGDYEFMIRPSTGASHTYLGIAYHNPTAW